MKLFKSLLIAIFVLGSFSNAVAKSSAKEITKVKLFKKVIPKRPPINDDGPGPGGSGGRD